MAPPSSDMPLDYDTLQLIAQLHGKHGQQVFGKIAQRLLAITLYDLSWTRIRDHTSEDADLDAISPEGEGHTFEVKTSETSSVTIGEKDIDSLKQRIADGYKGFFAVMQVGRRGEWFLTPYDPTTIRLGGLPLSRFRLNRDVQLSRQINKKFPTSVINYFTITYERGLDGLAQKMKELGIEMLE